jgi:hypothetical protein
MTNQNEPISIEKETTLPAPDAPVEAEEAPVEPNETALLTEGADAPVPPPVDYAALAAADLAEIKRLDPTYAPASHLSELPFARRFAALRDMGLSVVEALAAVTPRFSPYDTRSHLRPSAPGGARSPEGCLSTEEMKAAKVLFSDLSEKELQSLYRRVTAEI